MNFRLFESFREWVLKTRRRKDSKKPSRGVILEGARVGCSGGIRYNPALGEIISCLELAFAKFITEQRSPKASWLNIIQLTEPQLSAGELISTRKI